jgi:dolichyl-phosphate-mannose--protein O-mannosyl transferase
MLPCLDLLLSLIGKRELNLKISSFSFPYLSVQLFYLSRHIPYFFIAGVGKIYHKTFQTMFVIILRGAVVSALPNSVDDVRRVGSRGRIIIIIIIITIIIIIALNSGCSVGIKLERILKEKIKVYSKYSVFLWNNTEERSKI